MLYSSGITSAQNHLPGQPLSWEAEPQGALSNETQQINRPAREGHREPPPTVPLASAALRERCTAWAEEDLENLRSLPG